MSLFNIFTISGSGMSAQSLRLNTTASNIANANSVASSETETYRTRHLVFESELSTLMSTNKQLTGVKVSQLIESDAPLLKEFSPKHPLADKDGYIYKPDVNVMEQMADMISASRSYQLNVQVTEAAKSMLQQTLGIGK